MLHVLRSLSRGLIQRLLEVPWWSVWSGVLVPRWLEFVVNQSELVLAIENREYLFPFDGADSRNGWLNGSIGPIVAIHPAAVRQGAKEVPGTAVA